MKEPADTPIDERGDAQVKEHQPVASKADVCGNCMRGRHFSCGRACQCCGVCAHPVGSGRCGSTHPCPAHVSSDVNPFDAPPPNPPSLAPIDAAADKPSEECEGCDIHSRNCGYPDYCCASCPAEAFEKWLDGLLARTSIYGERRFAKAGWDAGYAKGRADERVKLKPWLDHTARCRYMGTDCICGFGEALR